MTVPLADYRTHVRSFADLCKPTCDANILFFSGGEGSGKTTLVKACLEQIPPGVTCVSINLRSSANTIPVIFRFVGYRLGWDGMPCFANQVAGMQRPPEIKVDQNWLIGIANHIDVALCDQDPADREDRRAILTDAWCNDLRCYPRPLLIAFDTYDAATPEVRDWIAGPFLARAAGLANLRVLIAGVQVPDSHNIDWGNWCVHNRLYGVPEAKEWFPIVEAMGRYIPFDPPLTWLAGVCHALKGVPKDIMQVIEGLPAKEVAV